MSENNNDAPRPPSFLERLTRARRLFWQTWGEEAEAIYRRTAPNSHGFRLRLVEALLFARELLREFWAVGGSSRAASLAYTTLLSLVPLVVAFSAVLSRFFARLFPDLPSNTDTLVNMLLPYQSSQIAYHMNRFTANAQAASTFGVLIFLFVSFRLFMAVEWTINSIWKVESVLGYRQKLRAFTMLFFWGPLLIAMSFTTTSSLERNPYLSFLVTNQVTGIIIPTLFLLVAFTMLFWLVPSTRVNIRSALYGALFAAISFELVRFGFGLYARTLFAGRLNVIYGTAGLVIIFLLALEVMWLIILIGVEISHVHQNFNGILRATEQQIEERPQYDLYFAIRALVEIARRFEYREDAPSSYRLAEEFGATDRQMLAVLRKLEGAQLVKEIGGGWTGFVPGGDADRITVEEIVRVIQGGGRELPPDADDPATREIGVIFKTLEDSTRSALDRKSIGQIVRELYGVGAPSRVSDMVRT